jgi:hypothetical protein
MGGHSEWDIARVHSVDTLDGATLQGLQPVAENCSLPHFQPLKSVVVNVQDP